MQKLRENNYSDVIGKTTRRHINEDNGVFRSSSDLANLSIQDAAAILEQMKKSGANLGGVQNNFGHSSLLMPGPVPKPDTAAFFSPQAQKMRNYEKLLID